MRIAVEQAGQPLMAISARVPQLYSELFSWSQSHLDRQHLRAGAINIASRTLLRETRAQRNNFNLRGRIAQPG